MKILWGLFWRTIALLAVLGWLISIAGCASAYPRPTNPNYARHGRLWYCYGPAWTWKPGATFAYDACRYDPCADMVMPKDECLGLGAIR